ncbi:MAG: hypothetical protein PVG71_00125, partial [Anaerolineae bacterium]
MLIVLEIGDLLLRRVFLQVCVQLGAEGLEDVFEVSFPQHIGQGLRPFPSSVACLAIDGVRYLPDVLSRVAPVGNLHRIE